KHPEVKTKAPNFPQVMDLLWKMGLVRDGDVELTDLGKKRINRLLVKYDDVPESADFQVRVGPIGTGNKVVLDPEIFNNLSENMRKVLGLEMEAMALGAVAHEHQDDIRHAIVMKGVMDHADEWKSDATKEFAARASAECLMAFLRAFLPPIDRFEGILDSGTADRPHAPGPSHLLHAKYQYISFYEAGRRDILRRLRAFCTEPAPTGVWLIHGEGGMGKTRLMIEFVKQLRSDGWVAGFLRASADKDRFTELITSDLPVFLVIDYAESRPELASLLADVARIRVRGAPLRFVLLARNAGDWWTMLLARDSSTTALLTERAPEALGPLVESAQRIDMVKKAADEFATIIGREKTSSVLPPLHDVRFERALYLHLAALAWVEGLFFTADTLLDEILSHEERFWVTQANAMNNGLAEYAFIEKTRRAVAAMTLCGGMASQHAGELLLGRISPRFDDELLAFLRRLYPGLKGTFTTGLEPDLLGDGMVWRTMTRMREQGDLPALFLDQVFRGEPEGALVAGFTVLGRLSVEHAQEVRPWIMHVLEGDIDARALAALRATKELGTKTAYAWVGIELAGVLERLGTVELARRLEEAGVPDGTVSMRELREWVTRKRLPLHSADDESIEARAKLAGELNDLGNRQSKIGQHEPALASTVEAVDIWRKLAEQLPDAYLPYLAMSLNNLGNRQIALGQREAALTSTQEAVVIRRQLAEQHPDIYQPDLAMSLNNLGNLQSALGQREAALASAQEAAATYQQLAKQRADAYQPDLAMSLNNLGIRQGELGQQEAALASTQDAVAIYGQLAEQRPDVYSPNLATSLHNLGARQSELGQQEAALASTQEAVAIYRQLGKQRPDVFLPELAGSSFNVAVYLYRLGRGTEALPIAHKTLDILWPRYEQFPAVHGRDIRNIFALLAALHKELNVPIDDDLNNRFTQFLAQGGS
ncbi:MAG TPA: tetratricopeptide repeat protein, partial [Polyangium sp.]|nr:tetratricopeptide repeat protein [Polyangium sp.]